MSPDLLLARLALAFYLVGVVVSFVSVLAGRSKLVFAEGWKLMKYFLGMVKSE